MEHAASPQDTPLPVSLAGVEVEQPPDPSVIRQWWVARLRQWQASFTVGAFLLLLSVPVLWVNEFRDAKMDSLMVIAAMRCRTIDSANPSKDNLSALVHVESAQMQSVVPVQDSDFGVKFEGDCIRLKRTVEVYQVIQTEAAEERQGADGNKEKASVYTYSEEWSSLWHDSTKYHDEAKQKSNTKPEVVELGTYVQNCRKVFYGEGFVLPSALVSQCHNFQSAAERIGEEFQVSDSGQRIKFTRVGDRFYHSPTGNVSDEAPQAGDVRVLFEYVPDCVASVVALQAEYDGARGEGNPRGSFLPYRLIPRSLISMQEEEEKRQLLDQARKSDEQLLEESTQQGILACVCCACTIMSMYFGKVFKPEAFHLFTGEKSMTMTSALQKVRDQYKGTSWLLRLGGWTLMYFGLYLLMVPFVGLYYTVPIVGPVFAMIGTGVLWILCGAGTVIYSLLIAAAAYVQYLPHKSVFFLSMVVLIIFLPFGMVILGVKLDALVDFPN